MLKPLFRARLTRARALLRSARLDALLVCPSADFTYLTGHPMTMRERPLFLVLTPARAALLAPELEAVGARPALRPLPVWGWGDGEPPMELLRARVPRLRRVAVNPLFRADWLLSLADTRPHPSVGSGAPVLDLLRSRKEPGEVRALRAAALQADRVMGDVRARLKPGVTEEALAQFILKRFVQLGATEPWALVASGPNGALPHHEFSSRKLRRGDVIVVDLGAALHGYQSDITRTFFLGRPEPEARRVYATVLAAQAAGRAAVRAGVTGRAADQAARRVIQQQGYGPYFIHRLGHGLGMEVHEAPYLAIDNPLPLPEGSVVTVEPGIYLPGRFGVRLEDVVVAGPRGARTLTTYPLDQPQL
ncbi:MAG TPA: aminopeptidase P family protein [Candidatus Saccharimonadales bacterium]|nr:aminopeptidase P family protein [Candidatus Saccharimonadales bacterium]